MNLDTYPVISSDDLLTHSFISEGPKGRILKHVQFQHIRRNEFNLAFGDWKTDDFELDDSARTNNKDRDKVLATVAWITSDFMKRYPYARIIVKGSTTSRNRLYQMKILLHKSEIDKEFALEGRIGDHWEPISPIKNYIEFSLTIKKNKYMKKKIPVKGIEQFDVWKWHARHALKQKIVPRDFFPDLSDHPFFKRKLEVAMEQFATCPPPDRKAD